MKKGKIRAVAATLATISALSFTSCNLKLKSKDINNNIEVLNIEELVIEESNNATIIEEPIVNEPIIVTTEPTISPTATPTPTPAMVTVFGNAEGYGTIQGAGEYLPNTQVTLTAQPADGYKFECWKDIWGNTVSVQPTYTFQTGESNASFTAVFSPLPTPTPVPTEAPPPDNTQPDQSQQPQPQQ